MEVSEKVALAACNSLGTGQCAALCLQHFSGNPHGCPEVKTVWTPSAVQAELTRRPQGPLKGLVG